MAAEKNNALGKGFAAATMPWVVGLGGLLVFLVTLNHWISLLGLGTVARISGWLWRPELNRPLTLLVLFPFRCLPEAWIPLLMNIFTAFCAAFVLMLLARSVALLRHDITPFDPLLVKQPVTVLSIPTAWMPPLLAATVCGLQLSFWEHATSVTGEMISLLPFAYAIRCLLEYRISQRQTWLSRCAFVYAAGMANSWVMIAYFPVCLAAIIMVRGFGSFLNLRFLARMSLWALAGLSLYLLLPAAHSLGSNGPPGFWDELKAHLETQGASLILLRSSELHALIFTSLLPFLILAIRWKSHTVHSGDDTKFGMFVVRATGHFMHGLFFICAFWIALNPLFSPRNLDLGTPLLMYYYIWALVLGYCAGYFLLLRLRGRLRSFAKAPAIVMGLILCAAPVELLWRNLGQIRTTNGPGVREFAHELRDDLPTGRSVALSEDSRQLLLLQAELSGRPDGRSAILLDTPSLVSREYQTFVAAEFKAQWPVDLGTNKSQSFGPVELRELVGGFATLGPVVYLHPSSGFFLETFMDRPTGSIHCLVPRPPVWDPKRTMIAEVAGVNEREWQSRWTNSLLILARQTGEKPATNTVSSRPLLSRLRLMTERNFTASLLGAWYSKSLDFWGVEMQRLGHWPEAGTWFERAIALNPGNVCARINAEYNSRHQHGQVEPLDMAAAEKEFGDLINQYDNWLGVLGNNGPVDEPAFLIRTGRLMLSSRNVLQASDAFERSAELAPDWLVPKLWLAQSRNVLQDYPAAVALTEEIQKTNPPQSGAGWAQLLYCRVTALRGTGQTNEADNCIESYVREQGKYGEVLSAAAVLCDQSDQFERELKLLDDLLGRNSNNADVLRRKGNVELQLKRFEPAITNLTKALELAPTDDEARLLRAAANLRADHLEDSRADYLKLLKPADYTQSALFGLGGIAWRERDTNAIVQYYGQFLSNAFPGSVQYMRASKRLKKVGHQ